MPVQTRFIRRKLRLCFLLFLLVFGCCTAAAVTASATEAKKETTSAKKKKGWYKVTKKSGKVYYYYISSTGKRVKGWLKLGTRVYYLTPKKGYRVTGTRTIDGKRYYFSDKGVRKTGWQTIGGHRYYFSKKTGYALTGLKKMGKYRYCFSDKGVLLYGWQKVKGKYYYADASGHLVKGLQVIDGETYYFGTTTGAMKTGTHKISGTKYYFNTNGTMLRSGYTPSGDYAYTDGKFLHKSTLKKLLKTALGPVGTTLYVWGGGWGLNDSSSGEDAVTMGVSPQWKSFFAQYGSGYDYTQTRYQTRDGLDCSGYVGWTLYNTFNTSSGNAGFVMLAENMASTYASYGWGEYTSAGSFSDYRAGDIMSLASGHVYITVGQCSDGSVVLLHSSPPGVMITGTYTPSGSKISEANALSVKYMKKYYPEFYNKFSSKLIRNTSYLTSYSRMRWYLSGKCVMADPDNFAGKNAKQVLRSILGA